MSIDFLEDLERDIAFGVPSFCCPEKTPNDWAISRDIMELRTKAQQVANAKRYPISIYRLVSPLDVGSGDMFFVVRRVLAPGPRGESRAQWTMVDTKEAAEMLRDVSHGPTPFFGACAVETFDPSDRPGV